MVLELIEPPAAHILLVDEEPVDALAVRWVHAAPSNPEVAVAPGPPTSSGLDTA
ncbi:hypothetical protein [Kitasatospora sp. McL0602]|uniref:hypothetical protein n=1 Tax=Kitasatospora sp. McL0602 TaxID=3439530 RepID=UPI003F88B9FE